MISINDARTHRSKLKLSPVAVCVSGDIPLHGGSSVEALNLQMKYANATMAEYMAEGKKLLERYGPQAAARRP